MPQSLSNLDPALKDTNVGGKKKPKRKKPPAFGYRKLKKKLLERNKEGRRDRS